MRTPSCIAWHVWSAGLKCTVPYVPSTPIHPYLHLPAPIHSYLPLSKDSITNINITNSYLPLSAPVHPRPVVPISALSTPHIPTGVWKNDPLTRASAMQSSGRNPSPASELVFFKLIFPKGPLLRRSICFTDTGICPLDLAPSYEAAMLLDTIIHTIVV